MLGASEDSLVQTMVDHGFAEATVWAELSRLEGDPALEAGRKLAGQLHKLEALLAVQQQLRSLAPSSGEVQRRRGVPESEFLACYYAQNRPVVLLDFAQTWKALGWTPESLKRALANETVEVMSGRDADTRYELNSNRHRSTIAFAEYADRVQAAGRSNDMYMVANNRVLDASAADPLWLDFDAGQPPLDGAHARGGTFLWFGPAGTVTPLHHDVMNVLFVQLYGRKRFTLIAPAFTPRIYNEFGVFAEVDPEHPDYDRHPDFRGVTRTDLILEPGDSLFLPVGWWHRVESLDISISLSFTNFGYQNRFHWQHPG